MWLLLFIPLVLLISTYAFLIEQYRKWFTGIPPFTPINIKPSARFSVVIPARNEEANILACLTSVLAQDYPAELFEVIVVNDHSTDATAAMVSGLQQQHANLKLLHLEQYTTGGALNAYKKKAIDIAIANATGDWIVTTDADCFVLPKWLILFDSCIQEKQPVFIAAPVKFINTGTLLSVFQCLDFLSLQGITAAAVYNNFHSMCNGANLAYSKAAFQAVEGFKGIDNVASGDDMLLMHKIYSRYPQQVSFLAHKAAIVSTAAMPTWNAFINQRIRWASKAGVYDDKRIFRVLLLVYVFNVALLVLLVASFFKPHLFFYWLLCVAAKTGIELRFMVPVANFFGEKRMLLWFPFMQPLHILYTVVAGWLGKFGSYRWKGRDVR